MKGGIGNLMKQAQKMQESMQKAQEELAQLEVVGEAGGGLVRVVMSCRHEVRRVEIEDTLLGEDKDMLEDLIAAAINSAVQRVEQTVREKYSGMASGLSLPGGLNLPFGS